MKKRIVFVFLALILSIGLSINPIVCNEMIGLVSFVYGDEEEYWDDSGEYYGEEYYGEEYYGEESYEYYGEEGEYTGEYEEGYYEENEYTGEYAEGYSEEAALYDEENWVESSEWTDETAESTEAQEGETPQEGEGAETPDNSHLSIIAEDGTIKKPVLASGSAAVYCRNTGELIFAKNADKRFSPYSTTKLLTALLAVQNLPMDQEVTISAAAAEQGGSTMSLTEGEVVTVEQLLYGTMILSGNDAAFALAETVSGDVDSFVNLMNETCSNLGCKNTRFANPNGLIDDTSQQYTTAKDFIEICKFAFANETLRKIAGANEYDMAATNISEAYKMEGHNELLLEGKTGYVAGKTGYWDDNNATIAMDYIDGTLELIVVALGGDIDHRSTDCDQLIDYARANIEGLKIVEKGEIVANVRVKHGAVTRTEAITTTDSFIYLPKQASKELINLVAVTDPDLTAPIKAGDPVGVYQIFLADEKIDEVPLVSTIDVEEGWILSYLGISNRATMIMLGLIALLIILIVIRALNRAGRRDRRRV